MKFLELENGEFGLFVDDAMLRMSREEAEVLFVSIGHTLQDADIKQYSEESTEGQQP